MKKQNLLASVALFRKLYDSDTYKSIPDIIAEFITGAIAYENKFYYSSEEIKDLLKKVYGFEILESVIRTTLKNKFGSTVVKEKNHYSFDPSIVENLSHIKTEFEHINSSHQNILNDLYNFISDHLKHDLTDIEKGKIFINFSHFLMDNGYADEYSDLISAYVIKRSIDLNFKVNINAIREGVILYQGINYTADLNQLGKWENELVIYLSTEHLFSCLGYNGLLFQEIFNDLFTLVNEINSSSHTEKSKRKKIELKYFEETKNEVDNFFHSAESILKGHKKIDPSKLAMENILKGCNTVSDIKQKQIIFYSSLKNKDILFHKFNTSTIVEYNVVDQDVIDNLKELAKNSNRHFDEEYCYRTLEIFTKINTLRSGVNNNPFERVGHIYLTENSFAKYLAHNNAVKFGDRDISFAKDIDFVITRLWFKLKKGFNKNTLPKSFDVITKAKIILASHTNSNISDEYDKLNQQFKGGKITEEEAMELSLALKDKPNTPEDINNDNIDNTLYFLSDDNFVENILRERQRKDAAYNSAIEELEVYKNKEKSEKEKSELKNSQLLLEKFVKSNWREYRNNGWKDLLLLLFVVLLNSVLSGTALMITISKDIKEWLWTFEIIPLMLMVIYVLTIVVEIIGSKYIFNRDRLKNGWVWILTLLSYKKKKKLIEQELKSSFAVKVN